MRTPAATCADFVVWHNAPECVRAAYRLDFGALPSTLRHTLRKDSRNEISKLVEGCLHAILNSEF